MALQMLLEIEEKKKSPGLVFAMRKQKEVITNIPGVIGLTLLSKRLLLNLINTVLFI